MIRLVGDGETLRVENSQTSIIRSNIKLAIEISKLGKDMRLAHLLRREKLDDILLFIYIPKAILQTYQTLRPMLKEAIHIHVTCRECAKRICLKQMGIIIGINGTISRHTKPIHPIRNSQVTLRTIGRQKVFPILHCTIMPQHFLRICIQHENTITSCRDIEFHTIYNFYRASHVAYTFHLVYVHSSHIHTKEAIAGSSHKNLVPTKGKFCQQRVIRHLLSNLLGNELVCLWIITTEGITRIKPNTALFVLCKMPR